MPNRRHYKPIVGMFPAIILAALLVGTVPVAATDFLTATDWQYLKSLGYDEHADALEKATKGQRKHLHKLINNRRISVQRKIDLVSGYLMAMPIGAVPK